MSPNASGIWIIDNSAKTLFANERMAEILGSTIPEIVGQHSFSFVYSEDVDSARRLFDAKMRGDAKPFRFRLRRKDGSAVWVEVQGTPMQDAAGVAGIVGTFTVVEAPVV